MQSRPGIFNAIARKAFEETYNRAINPSRPFGSAVLGFTGFQVKYKYKNTPQGKIIVREMDRNLYNWAEQIIFLPVRLIKNIAKLGTEFIWNLATRGLLAAASRAMRKAVEIEAAEYDEGARSISFPARSKILGYQLLAYFAFFASYLPWTIAKLGQSITSPFAAMKESYAYFAQPNLRGRPRSGAHAVVGFVAAGIRGLISIAAYAAIAVFAAPIVGGALIASGSVGTQIVTGLSLAATWASNLPIISTLGSAFVAGLTSIGSALGLNFSLGAGFVSAAAIASTAIAAAPALASLKAFVRWLSPFSTLHHQISVAKNKSVAAERNADVDDLSASNPNFQSLNSRSRLSSTHQVLKETRDIPLSTHARSGSKSNDFSIKLEDKKTGSSSRLLPPLESKGQDVQAIEYTDEYTDFQAPPQSPRF